MPDWDEDSPKLRQNLTRILQEIVEQAEQREVPTVELARRWQRLFMQGLKAEPRYVGAFRGEPSLERTFANGNGRTARLWANFIAVRYGLPPFVRLRPRPDEGYSEAGIKAMQGDWEPTAIVFRRLLNRFLEEFNE